MICKPCRSAAVLNLDAVMAPDDKVAAAYRQAACETHDLCKGGTRCDCQHVVGRTAKAGREPK